MKQKRFSFTVSHELRTPLTSVSVLPKSLKKAGRKNFPATDISDPRTKSHPTGIRQPQCRGVGRPAADQPDQRRARPRAKIEAGKMEWSQDNVFIPEVAERAIAATTPYLIRKISLVKEIETELPEITGDKDKLIQVMVNLISNAVKFTPQGTVTCRVYRDREEIVVSISDTGIGLPKRSCCGLRTIQAGRDPYG
jgi:signal transduction histidine kinase